MKIFVSILLLFIFILIFYYFLLLIETLLNLFVLINFFFLYTFTNNFLKFEVNFLNCTMAKIGHHTAENNSRVLQQNGKPA